MFDFTGLCANLLASGFTEVSQPRVGTDPSGMVRTFTLVSNGQTDYVTVWADGAVLVNGMDLNKLRKVHAETTTLLNLIGEVS